MTNPAEDAAPPLRSPPAFWALTQLAAFHQKSIDPGQLIRALGLEGRAIGVPEILLACAEIPLKATSVPLAWADLATLKQPALGALQDGGFVIVGRRRGDQLPVTEPGAGRPTWVTEAEWTARATGTFVLVTERLHFDNPNRPFGLGWFVPVLHKYRKALGEVLLAAFFFQLLGIGLPLFIQVMIDRVFVFQNHATLLVVAIGMLVVIVFEGLFGIVQSILLAHVGNRVDTTLGSAIYRHLVRVPLRYFENRRVGDTTARVREVERIRQFLTGHALLSVVDGLFVFVYIGILLLYSLRLTGIVLLAMVAIAGVTVAFRGPLRRRMEASFDADAHSQAFLVESLTGMGTLKAMALEPQMSRRWDALLAHQVTAGYQADRLQGIAGGISRALQNLTTLAILWVGAGLVLHGDLTVGALIAFQMLARRAVSPVLRVSLLWQHFQQVGVGVQRLGDLMNVPAEPVLDPTRSSLPALKGAVQCEAVTFRYQPEGPRVLDQVSLTIAPGTVVGIVGRSGSGKSTLAKLLARLYTPESGRILVDGQDLAQVDPGWLRRQIAVVPQESFLFGGTIRENIAVRAPGLAMARIIEAATLAGAHDFIGTLPQGYDTPTGERGASLSGGQRQRIAIARALVTDPRLLIFDEATSALDYESERIIQDNLQRICAGRTVIIISHRFSFLRAADRIYVLDGGRLVEEGDHRDLVDARGLYHHLCTQQGLAA